MSLPQRVADAVRRAAAGPLPAAEVRGLCGEFGRLRAADARRLGRELLGVRCDSRADAVGWLYFTLTERERLLEGVGV